MRKIAIAMMMVVMAACAGKQGPSAAADPMTAAGAATPKQAVESFLAAVRSQDLQGMSAYWGSEKGPAREHLQRDELEKRLIIMQCNLQHDTWSFAESEPRLAAGGSQDFKVSLKKKTLSATTTVKTVQGPDKRWYVLDIDLTQTSQFCR